MDTLIDILFLRTWWRYDPGDPLHSVPYHWLNLIEGTFWLGFAALVLRRWACHRRSPTELAYAAAFVTFALTDFREAYALQSWLIWLKLLNLVALLWLRRHVMKHYYPASRVY